MKPVKRADADAVRVLSRTHRVVALAHEGCHRAGLPTNPVSWKRLNGQLGDNGDLSVVLANRLDPEALYVLGNSPVPGVASHRLAMPAPGLASLHLMRFTVDAELGELDWSGSDELRPIAWHPGRRLVVHGRHFRRERRPRETLDRMERDEAALRRALRGSGVRIAIRRRLGPTEVQVRRERTRSAALRFGLSPSTAGQLGEALRLLWQSSADLARDVTPEMTLRLARDTARWLEGTATELARPTRQCIERITGLQARLSGTRLVPTLGSISALGPRVDASGRIVLTDLTAVAMAVPERDLACLLGAVARAPMDARSLASDAVGVALAEDTAVAIDRDRLEIQRLVRALGRARAHCLRLEEDAVQGARALLVHALGG